MTIDEKLNENAFSLGSALQFRAAMQAQHRNDPSTVTAEWLEWIRREVRKLQAKNRRLEDARYRMYSEAVNS